MFNNKARKYKKKYVYELSQCLSSVFFLSILFFFSVQFYSFIFLFYYFFLQFTHCLIILPIN